MWTNKESYAPMTSSRIWQMEFLNNLLPHFCILFRFPKLGHTTKHESGSLHELYVENTRWFAIQFSNSTLSKEQRKTLLPRLLSPKTTGGVSESDQIYLVYFTSVYFTKSAKYRTQNTQRDHNKVTQLHKLQQH